MAAPTQSINLEIFSKKIRQMYSHWNHFKNEMWGGSDAFSVATPPPSDSDDHLYLKSSALNIWLLGYEFPGTIMLFMKKQIHFLCSQKKASLLQALTKPARDAVGVEVIMHVKGRSDDGYSLMDDILQPLRGSDRPIFGHIARETPQGDFLAVWDEKLRNANLEQLRDVTNGLSDLFAAKDPIEIRNVKRAAHLTSSVVKHFVMPELSKVIDKLKEMNHSSLTNDTIMAITEPSRVKVKLRPENVDICYPPVFQSRLGTESKDDNIGFGVVIYALGSRYRGYCSNVARTWMVSPNSVQRKAYKVLWKAQEAAIAALRPGNKAADAYLAAVGAVGKQGPEFAPHLTKSAGSGIGLELCDSSLELNGENERVLRSGMVFNVSLGLENLPRGSHGHGHDYSLLLADTVIVGQTRNQVVTSTCVKAPGYVLFLPSPEDEMIEDNTEESVRRVCKIVSARYDSDSDSSSRSPSPHYTRRRRRRSMWDL